MPEQPKPTLELLLLREYKPNGTNGDLSINGKFHSHTIELPWHNNEKGKSCIPEGRYQLMKRDSDHHGHHLILCNTSPRELILIHKANNALKELRGCIAPVTTITGQGTGSESKKVFDPLIKTVYAALDNKQQVWLTIKKK
jgi:hypothetical protein